MVGAAALASPHPISLLPVWPLVATFLIASTVVMHRMRRSLRYPNRDLAMPRQSGNHAPDRDRNQPQSEENWVGPLSRRRMRSACRETPTLANMRLR
jgi:hypothetical protein